jgi:tripeptidyl-peptidase-1
MQTQIAFIVASLSLCGIIFSFPVLGGPAVPGDGISRDITPSYVIHERHDAAHLVGWTKRERADAEWVLPVRIGLKQSNVDKGHELLMDM